MTNLWTSTTVVTEPDAMASMIALDMPMLPSLKQLSMVFTSADQAATSTSLLCRQTGSLTGRQTDKLFNRHKAKTGLWTDTQTDE